MPFVFVAAPQYCDGAYISKGGTTTKNKKNEKKMKKKTTQTSLISIDNCQIGLFLHIIVD
jgi:hypothetical protein